MANKCIYTFLNNNKLKAFIILSRYGKYIIILYFYHILYTVYLKLMYKLICMFLAFSGIWWDNRPLSWCESLDDCGINGSILPHSCFVVQKMNEEHAN